MVPLVDDTAEHPWPLAGMPGDIRRALFSRATERHYDPDDVIYLAGSPAQHIYLISDGKVRLVRDRDGRTIHIHDECSGGVLGEVPLFEGSTYPATAIASQPTRCLVLRREAILDVMRIHPELGVAILQRLAARVRQLVNKIERNASQPTVSRLAELVLARAQAYNGDAFTIGASQEKAAEEIGTVRELVVRGLRSLREQGAIDALGNGRYTVRDAEKLKRIATCRPDPRLP
jgi:CRP-like cAMP-binding protein